jgi:uncharacterized membrane protein (DUF441 family)
MMRVAMILVTLLILCFIDKQTATLAAACTLLALLMHRVGNTLDSPTHKKKQS